MATRAKKQQRRQRRRERRRLNASGNAPLHLTCDADVELTAADSAEGEPKTPTFSLTAYTGDRMRPSGWGGDVVVDLAGVRSRGGKRPILLNHDPTQIVGHTDSIEISTSIRATGVVSGSGSASETVVASSQKGFPWRASIGATPERIEQVMAGKTVEVNGRRFTGPIDVVRRSTLNEISFVSIAADNRTSARVAASESLPGDSEMTFEKWLEAKGFDVDQLSDDQKVLLKSAYDAEQQTIGGVPNDPHPPPNPDDVSQQLRASAARETRRINRITEICAQYQGVQIEANGQTLTHAAIAPHAIENDWSAQDLELQLLRASRTQAPAVQSRSHETDCTLEALQGAQLLRAGVRLDHPAFASTHSLHLDIPDWLRHGPNHDASNRIMEAAHSYSDLSMIDLCRHAVRLDGNNVPSGRQKLIKAAFSGSALTNLFTTNVNTVILATYMEFGDTTQGWTSTVDVADFKTNERPRMEKGPNLAKLPRGGEADHYDRSDVLESYKIARYAKQFVVDEQDIIDDRFNALGDMPRELGFAAARLRPDLVYSILFANDTLNATSRALFNTTDGNLRTSAALADATLKNAITDMRTHQENSVNLNLMPTHLIVPATLDFTARGLLNSSEVRDTTASTFLPTANTLQGRVANLVTDPRLDNGVTDPDGGTAHAGATGDWYLASSQGHTIEVAYLRGSGRAPMVRSFTLAEGKYGMGWDVKLDIGAKALDWRALHKSEA